MTNKKEDKLKEDYPHWARKWHNELDSVVRRIVDKMCPAELDTYVYNTLYDKLEENPELIDKYKKAWGLDDEETV